MSIFDSNAVWRKTLQPAYYNNCRFHMEVGTIEGGRRQVLHQVRAYRQLVWLLHS